MKTWARLRFTLKTATRMYFQDTWEIFKHRLDIIYYFTVVNFLFLITCFKHRTMASWLCRRISSFLGDIEIFGVACHDSGNLISSGSVTTKNNLHI